MINRRLQTVSEYLLLEEQGESEKQITGTEESAIWKHT
jgi:hypothetical protein